MAAARKRWKPHTVVQVDCVLLDWWQGQPVRTAGQLDVYYLPRSSGRRRSYFCAKPVGTLGWDIGNTPRAAMAKAAGVRPDQRPTWLAEAVKKVNAELVIRNDGGQNEN